MILMVPKPENFHTKKSSSAIEGAQIRLNTWTETPRYVETIVLMSVAISQGAKLESQWAEQHISVSVKAP
jgi:hypothetical protein